MSPADTHALASLRSDIEQVDAELMACIARRMQLAREIRVVKQRAGQPVLDPAREAAVVMRAAERARAAGLPEDEIRALYWKVMAVARRVQSAEI
ncbi:chorismate mutase [Gemmatimonas sp.]|jgi:chorismate mutase|uniref:chorismate mutase n=1 Tax=Gemmatimonas sp. TaxID=1962908 RepID=UPI0031BDED4E|nr:chorismate mutase [Gemmatimonas sp.]